MSFRGKVKAVLRVNESERLRRRDQAHGLQGEDTQMAAWNALTPAQKARLKRKAKKAKKVKKKYNAQDEQDATMKGYDDAMAEKERLKGVKAKIAKKVNEAKKVKKKVTVAQAHKIARAKARASEDPEVLRKRSPDYVPTEEDKKEWAAFYKAKNENSEHPFYQKVKELSRGKKNKSLLEKKSNKIKTFKILLGTVGKKSKMDEAKDKKPDWDAYAIEIERQRRMSKYGSEQPHHKPDLPPLPAPPKESQEDKKKEAPKERRKKPRGGTNDRLNNLARKLGIGGNWF